MILTVLALIAFAAACVSIAVCVMTISEHKKKDKEIKSLTEAVASLAVRVSEMQEKKSPDKTEEDEADAKARLQRRLIEEGIANILNYDYGVARRAAYGDEE